jgi:hypothetical protein
LRRAFANQDVAEADLGDVKLGSQSPQLTRPDSAKQGHPTLGCQLLVQRATEGCPEMGTDLDEHVAPADLDGYFCADHVTIVPSSMYKRISVKAVELPPFMDHLCEGQCNRLQASERIGP